MNAELCRAIHQRRRIQFGYEPGIRLVDPYAYGVGDGGRELLRAYQVSGDSFSREEGWKLFHVEEMSDLVVLDDTFDEPKMGYMRNDPSMTMIYCEI